RTRTPHFSIDRTPPFSHRLLHSQFAATSTMSNPLPIFAFFGTGTGELLDLICSGIKKVESADGSDNNRSETS
ncbi:hypothetical protein H5410_042586, partial [Solanum commersonii]